MVSSMRRKAKAKPTRRSEVETSVVRSLLRDPCCAPVVFVSHVIPRGLCARDTPLPGRMALIATSRLVSDPHPGLSSRHRLVVAFLLDLAGYLSADAHRKEADAGPYTGKRDSACLFRRALALASRPCLEAIRAGLIQMRGEARDARHMLRAEVLSEFLEEVELRLSLFRDMMVGSPAD